MLIPSAAHAGGPSEPLTDLSRAESLASEIGHHRTGGIYSKGDRLVVAVTDEAAATAVQDAGGIPEKVTRSTAELSSIHDEFDAMGGIPNTSWGVDIRANQVSVDVFDGVSEANRARIGKSAAIHPGAVRMEKKSGRLVEDTVLRGGMGIVSDHGALCSAGFNVANSDGHIFNITAGHCIPGGNEYWNVRYDGSYFGRVTSWRNSGGDPDTGADYATVSKGPSSTVKAYGTIKRRDGSIGQIDRSRFSAENQNVKRVGSVSEDLNASVDKTNVTVTFNNGIERRGMVQADYCALGGDSGGAVFNGTVALGIHSGSSVSDPGDRCNDSLSETSFYEPVQRVLNQHGLHVY